jgi:dephospho-CoA kinase
MSATGKSTLIAEMRRRGYAAVDLDEPGWSETQPGVAADGAPFEEWVWREDRVRDLLAQQHEVLFVSGCASNQGQFYPQFDHVVLLTAPVEVTLQRLASRTTNNFGKRPEEVARILEDKATVEPLLRRRATLEIDTRAPLEDVVSRVLAVLEAGQ